MKNEDEKSASRRASSDDLVRYGWLALALLIVLTSAILTPDYLNYRYRLALLQSSGQSYQTASVSSPKPPSAATTANAAQPITLPTAALPRSHETIKPAETTAVAPPISNSDIFETYGKLITMLLSFVAVIGVIAGYFVRKSVRELNDDIRQDVTREINQFEREKKIAIEEAKRLETDAKATCVRVEKLELEIQKELQSLRRNLEILNATIPNTETPKQASIRSIDEDARALDAEIASSEAPTPEESK